MNPNSLPDEQREAALKTMAGCLTELKANGLKPKDAAGVLLEMAFHALTHRSSVEQALHYLDFAVSELASRYGDQR